MHRGANGSFGFSHDCNNLITSIHQGGPAEEVGCMKEGDKIYSINEMIPSNDAFGCDAYQILKICDSTVDLVMNRAGNETKFLLTII